MEDKRFLLIREAKDGHDVVTWHDSEENLMECAGESKSLRPYDAIEVISYREIELPTAEEE